MLKHLLDNRSQLSTLDFQSQVCLSISKARPAGHRTAANRMVPANPARSHLEIIRGILVPCMYLIYLEIIIWQSSLHLAVSSLGVKSSSALSSGTFFAGG